MKISYGRPEKICGKNLDRMPDLAEPLRLAVFRQSRASIAKPASGVHARNQGENSETTVRLVVKT
jgi:hypothetical protein